MSGRATDYREDGRPARVVGYLRDVTRELHADEERVRAEQASRAKGAFLAQMSHEIRTPLNAMLGFAQLLDRAEDLSDTHRRHLERILRSGEMLNHILSDVLEISRIEAGKIELRPVEFELVSLIDDVETTFRQQAEARGLVLLVGSATELPRLVRGDRGRIRQVLFNLVGNAVKFTPRGRVEVHLAGLVDRARARLALTVDVEDTGVGISEAEQERIFDVFSRLDDLRHDQGGTGLGLSISRRLARLMGGDVTVQSVVGQGSTFRLQTDLEIVQGPTPARRTPGQSPGRRRVVRPKPPPLVFVVDDHAANCELMAEFLELVGFRSESVTDPRAAVARLSAVLPDAMLLDLWMPGLDGYGVLELMRAGERTRGVPVVVVSASAMQPDRDRAAALGARAFLSKPVLEDDILDALASCVDVELESPA